ncbi:cytochrome c oxidase assembly protein PET191-domain-containing protein [Cristinia sonorae]|uniref:Cytochrome c oxidase assembly protein PET191-domain-containing protein n=1 Tax=Cristinia sonorae TaxID=1940300 RepID=A0A8K0UIB7_9AGAR|nr:cytochrome c oxidase assembly protein PET191-domain-containing protein [Cristinia sonorae]
MSLTCEPLLAALKECLLRSDCVVKQGRLPSECLKEHTDELPEECKSLRKATFECKRNMLDMRKRFRGTNAGAVASKIKEGPGSGEGSVPRGEGS